MSQKKLEIKHKTSSLQLPKSLYGEFYDALQSRDLEQLEYITDSHDISSWLYGSENHNALRETLVAAHEAFKKKVAPYVSLSNNNIDVAEFTTIIRELLSSCDQSTLFINILYESKIKMFKLAIQEYRLQHRLTLSSTQLQILNYLETVLEIIVPIYLKELRHTRKIIEALCCNASINNFVKLQNPLLTAIELRNFDYLRMLLQEKIPIDSSSNNQNSPVITYLIDMLIKSDSVIAFEKNKNFILKVFEEFSQFGIDGNYALHQAIILCNYHLTQFQIERLATDNSKLCDWDDKFTSELEKFAHSLSQLIKHTCKFWHQSVEEEKSTVVASIGKSSYPGVAAITHSRYKKLTNLDYVVSSNFGIVVSDDALNNSSDDETTVLSR